MIKKYFVTLVLVAGFFIAKPVFAGRVRMLSLCAAAFILSAAAWTVVQPKPVAVVVPVIEGEFEEEIAPANEATDLEKFLERVKSDPDGLRFRSRKVTFYENARKENAKEISVGARLHFTLREGKLEISVNVDNKRNSVPPFWSTYSFSVNDKVPQLDSFQEVFGDTSKVTLNQNSYAKGVLNLYTQAVVSRPGANDSLSSARCLIQLLPDGSGIQSLRIFRRSKNDLAALNEGHAWLIEGEFSNFK